MSDEPEFVCLSCQKRYSPAPKSGLELAGMAVTALAGLAALGMLLFLQRGDTGPGGFCAVASVAALGLGMWLQKRGRQSCPSCGAKH